jgi:hypothetical protein
MLAERALASEGTVERSETASLKKGPRGRGATAMNARGRTETARFKPVPR